MSKSSKFTSAAALVGTGIAMSTLLATGGTAHAQPRQEPVADSSATKDVTPRVGCGYDEIWFPLWRAYYTHCHETTHVWIRLVNYNDIQNKYQDLCVGPGTTEVGDAKYWDDGWWRGTYC